ncbi:MAG TPA: DUF1592 domain-containing protein [Polyangiaceae bacterium]|nr:DUF1592 domain-containing protein [Polyangiaceae bacterium]
MLRTGSNLTPWCGAALAVFVAACSGGKLTGTDAPANATTGPDGTVLVGAGGSGGAGSSNPIASGGDAAGGAAGAGAIPQTDLLSDPGVVALRRLNRTQYNNTVRDLLGTTLTPADGFPADDLMYGFDNIGQALSVSTLLVDGYDSAARSLIDDLFARPTSAEYARFVVCDVAAGGASCGAQILQAFAEKAWRRPVVPGELDAFTALLTSAATPDEGLRLAMQMVLESPHFMFRVEIDPNPDVYEAHALNAYELASRLSYLMWNTMPDDGLFAAAQSGDLLTDAGLSTQLDRLLADSKASAFIDDMAGMWLHTRKLNSITRDATLFPSWDDDLRQSMQAETRAFFNEFFQNDLPVTQMVTANFTFANQRLATHYGLTGVTSTDVQKVDLTGNMQRMGLLTQGTFLTSTSRTTRTAPVLRGKWVLDQLLCSPPPPPPPNVQANLEAPNFEGLTLRQRLDLHKMQGAVCFSCHATMDPIGLGLENYDAIGAYRTADPDGAIDASGELPGTPPQPFSGGFQLAQLIGADPRFERCVTQQLMTYGLGMKPIAQWIDAIKGNAAATGPVTFKSVLKALVASDAFRQRRAAPVDTAALTAAASSGGSSGLSAGGSGGAP